MKSLLPFILLVAAAAAQQSPAAGDNVILFACGASSVRQQFDLPTAGNQASEVVLVSTEHSNPVLVWDISGPSNQSGAVIHLWGSYQPRVANQEWTYSVGPGTFQSAYNSMCLSVEEVESGQKLVLAACNPADPAQQFDYANSVFSSRADPTLCLQGGFDVLNCTVAPLSTYPYCNASLSTDARVADLVSHMTLLEQAAALDTSVPAIPRLGVPALPSGEALHGVACGCISPPGGPNNTGCPTSFPSPAALGAAFDPALWQAVGEAIGLEGRALFNAGANGALRLFAPNINLARDPRWGRNQEVPGEDPALVSAYAQAFISGLQGAAEDAPDPRYLLAAATAKHAAVYDLEGFIPRTDVLPRPPTAVCDTPGGCQRWNLDGSPPARDFAQFYIAPFNVAVKNASVEGIMCSYNALYGKPACGSAELITQYLRGELGYAGHVVSDCTAIELMQDAKYDNCPPPYPPVTCQPSSFPGHNFTTTAVETANAALSAGTDLNCGPFYQMWLAPPGGLAANGSVPAALVSAAATRLYRAVFLLGLLDSPVGQAYPALPPSTVDSQEHRALARRAAAESLVLLKNGGALPLKGGGAGLKLAFIGPHANTTQDFLSNYHGTNTLVDAHSPLAAAASRGLDVMYAKGCNICDIVPPGYPNMPCPPGQATNRSGFAAAVAAAAAADVA